MPRNLLDLPEEVLEPCLGELLPPLSENPLNSLNKLSNIPVPEDLLKLLLVCKALNRLAFPLVWRRAVICLGDGPVFPSRLVPGQLDYLCGNPEVAGHIRILRLQVTQSKHSSLFLAAFHFLLGHLRNIQVLHFSCDFFSHHHRADTICRQLISKPRLHTLLIHDYAPTINDRVPSLPSLIHLRHLDIWTSPWHRQLLGSAPHLTSLSITGEDVYNGSSIPATTLPIPWGTLREISLLDVEDLNLVFENFLSWKKSHPDMASPLTEISIKAFEVDITKEQIETVIAVFKGQIEYFSLAGFNSVDELCLDQLVHAFPRLRDLQLFTGGSTWDAKLMIIANKLGKLQNLRRLYWDYEGTMRFRNIVPVLSQQCRALESVMFYEDGVKTFYTIRRDVTGLYASYVEKVGGDHALLSTSSWHPRNYD